MQEFQNIFCLLFTLFLYIPSCSMTLEYRAAWKKGRKLPAAPLRVCGFLSSSTAATVNVV